MSLLNEIPSDGCLLVFNGKHKNWRTKASELGFLSVSKLSGNTVPRGDSDTVCDLIVTWRENYD